jgi:hypothetical protein
VKEKILSLFLCLSLIVGLSACGSGTQKPIDASGTDAAQASEKPAVTIKADTVLLDRDGLVITAKGLTDDPVWGVGVNVLLENNSGKNLGVNCNSLIVNNYMIFDLFSSSIATGKKANETIYLSSSGLEEAGIDTICDIVVSFHVYDSDTCDTLFDTDEIELKTSAYGTVEQPALDDGKELLNQNGIRIVGRYVEEDSFWGAGVLLFIKNDYGKNVVVNCYNMSVNGFMVTPYFSCTVNSGRMALDEITILSTDLEKNGIKSVDDIELAFEISDADTYHTIIETEPISFSAK